MNATTGRTTRAFEAVESNDCIDMIRALTGPIEEIYLQTKMHVCVSAISFEAVEKITSD